MMGLFRKKSNSSTTSSKLKRPPRAGTLPPDVPNIPPPPPIPVEHTSAFLGPTNIARRKSVSQANGGVAAPGPGFGPGGPGVDTGFSTPISQTSNMTHLTDAVQRSTAPSSVDAMSGLSSFKRPGMPGERQGMPGGRPQVQLNGNRMSMGSSVPDPEGLLGHPNSTEQYPKPPQHMRPHPLVRPSGAASTVGSELDSRPSSMTATGMPGSGTSTIHRKPAPPPLQPLQTSPSTSTLPQEWTDRDPTINTRYTHSPTPSESASMQSSVVYSQHPSDRRHQHQPNNFRGPPPPNGRNYSGPSYRSGPPPHGGPYGPPTHSNNRPNSARSRLPPSLRKPSPFLGSNLEVPLAPSTSSRRPQSQPLPRGPPPHQHHSRGPPPPSSPRGPPQRPQLNMLQAVPESRSSRGAPPSSYAPSNYAASSVRGPSSSHPRSAPQEPPPPQIPPTPGPKHFAVTFTANQIDCFNGHKSLVPMKNFHNQLPCFNCRRFIVDGMQCCSFCAIRLCRECASRLKKEWNGDITKGWGGVESAVAVFSESVGLDVKMVAGWGQRKPPMPAKIAVNQLTWPENRTARVCGLLGTAHRPKTSTAATLNGPHPAPHTTAKEVTPEAENFGFAESPSFNFGDNLDLESGASTISPPSPVTPPAFGNPVTEHRLPLGIPSGHGKSGAFDNAGFGFGSPNPVIVSDSQPDLVQPRPQYPPEPPTLLNERPRAFSFGQTLNRSETQYSNTTVSKASMRPATQGNVAMNGGFDSVKTTGEKKKKGLMGLFSKKNH